MVELGSLTEFTLTLGILINPGLTVPSFAAAEFCPKPMAQAAIRNTTHTGTKRDNLGLTGDLLDCPSKLGGTRGRGSMNIRVAAAVSIYSPVHRSERARTAAYFHAGGDETDEESAQ